jgi:hypothetical protein
MNKDEKIYALVPLLLLCGFYIYKSADFPTHDFSNYYFAGLLLAKGKFISEIYFPHWFNLQITGIGFSGIYASYAPNTPFLPLIFYPFSFLSVAISKLVFNILSSALLIYSCLRLARHYKIRSVFLLLLPIIFLVPIKNSLLFGQVYFLLFFLLTEMWLAYENSQFKKVGIFLALAICLKVFPALLLLIFLFQKQYKPFAYTIVGCVFLTVLSSIFVGFETWVFYFTEVLPKSSNGEIASAFVDNYQSVLMFLKRLFVFDASENPGSLFNSTKTFSVLLLAFKASLIAIGFYVSKKVQDALIAFAYWIVVMILVSPYGSTYTFILLIFPLFAILKSSLANWLKLVVVVFSFGITNFPLLTNFPFPLSYSRLFMLTLFFAFLIFILRKSIQWRVVAIVAVLPLFLLFFPDSKNTTSETFLKKKFPDLIYDYTISGSTITYYYWNERGVNKAAITIPLSGSEDANLIDNNIYYYGRLLVGDNSQKRKPVVINGKTLLYLSDYGRGIGFYTLRKMELK